MVGFSTNKHCRYASNDHSGHCPDSESIDELLEETDDPDPYNLPFRAIFMDEFDEQVQHYEMDFTPANNLDPLPEGFEQLLSAMPSETLCKHIREVTRKDKDELRQWAKFNRPDKVAQTDIRHFFRDHGLDPSQNPTTPGPSLSTSKQRDQEPGRNVPPTPPNKTVPQKGRDFLPFRASTDRQSSSGMCGVLHDLPCQSGIPGFQRLTFLSYDKSGVDSLEDLATLEDGDFTCNEGIVLPGGHMIIGRWWFDWYHEPKESGPFIMWEVEE